MRGKVKTVTAKGYDLRITPAYAGKSCKKHDNTICTQDHPRLCGEKMTNFIPAIFTLGSPPPMRGKVASIESYKLVDGITPAYAGKRANFDSTISAY